MNRNRSPQSSEQTQTQEETGVCEASETKTLLHWRVILYNDEDHTYDYVVELLVKVCKLSRQQAFCCAVEVDLAGRTTVFYGNEENCRRISAQINSYGPDHRLLRSRGSMRSEVEC